MVGAMTSTPPRAAGSRDAALRLLRRLTYVAAAVAAGATVLFAAVAAMTNPGQSEPGNQATPGASTAAAAGSPTTDTSGAGPGTTGASTGLQASSSAPRASSSWPAHAVSGAS